MIVEQAAAKRRLLRRYAPRKDGGGTWAQGRENGGVFPVFKVLHQCYRNLPFRVGKFRILRLVLVYSLVQVQHLRIDFLFGDNLFIAKNKALKYSSITVFWTSVCS